jgi:hypothetical protein
LQYFTNNTWKEIPGAAEKDNKYAQVFFDFKQPVSTSKVRFASSDKGSLKVREIKLFGVDEGSSAEPSYNVSGIQRTGEVVRLFAKGFKEERPLFETKSSVDDNGLDSYTSYDEKSGNYYMWLVQRGLFDYNLNVNLAGLDVAAGSPVIAETVNPNNYGEVTSITTLPANKKFNLTLSPQSVVLLTIPKATVTKTVINAVADAAVSGGTNVGTQKQLTIRLDASQQENNRVSYIYFDLAKQPKNTRRVILTVNGRVDKGNNPYRLHVYAIPSEKLDHKLTWKNAPLLDSKEVLIKEVGQKAFVAGEMAFNSRQQDHMLDVTDVVKKHASNGVTFVFVRETRQLGDDEDKGREVIINSSESNNKPKLLFWATK